MSIAEKLITVAENEQRVYNAGHDVGYHEGYEAGRNAGGGGGGNNGIFTAKITPTSDMSWLTVRHNLGTTDILLAACFAETLGDVTPTFNGSLAKFFGRTSIPNQRSGAGFNVGYYWQTTNSYAVGSQPSSASSYDSACGEENEFTFFRSLTTTSNWIAGVTYTVVIMAASAFKEG